MKPVSEVYNIDCMEYMKTIPDKFFDLAVVDPPYGIGNWVQTTGNIRRKSNDVKWNNQQDRPTQIYFKELNRISVDRIIWGANYYNCFDGEMGAIVWDKQNPNPKFSNVEIASYSRLRRVAKCVIPYYGFVGEDKCFHPCAKPIGLYKWLLKNYAKKGFKILDTHMGSQSSRIAAFQMGFDYYGCELDKEYFEQGCKRFDLVTSQQQLFRA